MEEAVRPEGRPLTFNGPLEAGIRAVCILGAAHPKAFDLQRLIALDYLLVHTGDIGGPESLHPEAPFQSAALLVRRKLIENALLLMMTRDLVRREISNEGIHYRAGENASTFLAALETDYLKSLKKRARWLNDVVGKQTGEQFRALMRRFFEGWIEEFQNAERSLGADS
jgi:hypothetical protein